MHAQWYVVMTGGSAGFMRGRRIVPEYAAVSCIGDEGYAAFCPTRRTVRRARDGQRLREIHIAPLWDGYVFAQLDERALGRRLDAWRAKGSVWDVIRREGSPVPLADDFISWVRSIETDVAYDDITGRPAETAVMTRLLRVGQTVEHLSAAFVGVRGRITKVDRDNIEFLADLLGAPRVLRAKSRDLEIVAQA